MSVWYPCRQPTHVQPNGSLFGCYRSSPLHLLHLPYALSTRLNSKSQGPYVGFLALWLVSPSSGPRLYSCPCKGVLPSYMRSQAGEVSETQPTSPMTHVSQMDFQWRSTYGDVVRIPAPLGVPRHFTDFYLCSRCLHSKTTFSCRTQKRYNTSIKPRGTGIPNTSNAELFRSSLRAVV